jgi:hypothetical protein
VVVEHLVDVVDDGGAVLDDGEDLGLERLGEDAAVGDGGIVLEQVEDQVQLGELARDGRQVGAGLAAAADEGGDGQRRLRHSAQQRDAGGGDG